MMGSMVQVTATCDCGYVRTWKSQPMSNSMPLGNLILAGAILFSGSNPSKVINFMKHCCIEFISHRTYNYMQKAYVVPTVNSVWERKQQDLLDSIREEGRELKLGGDARCCSPGHTAKYGSYSLMDLTTSKVIDIQLVQSNEVKNSYAMELEGLIRCLEFLSKEGVVISHLITDRHSQVKKYMKDQKPEIVHMFDVWHVAKGVYKKLDQKGKSAKKGFDLISQWSRSISNHLYWCAASSESGEELKEKWLSILNHCTNIHEGHGHLFPKCLHGPLEDRAWIKKDSLVHKEMEKIVMGRLLLKDIIKLSPAEQTSGLESFHNVVCYFAPKSNHFFYWQMRARLFLSALHFNENSNRKQAVTPDGKLQFSISYPKGRKGDAIAKEVKVKQTFSYIDELMEELLIYREANPSFKRALQIASVDMQMIVPPPIAEMGNRREKEDVVEAHIRRFNK